jgi:SagB-type dehydrogenase family enzyme
MDFPQEILNRCRRIAEFHESTKISSRQGQDLAGDVPQPSPFRIFQTEKIPLPTNLIGASTATIPLLRTGLDAVPASHRQPPQDLRTLATWLHLGAGNLRRLRGQESPWLRACPSEQWLYPCEIYVAAFGVAGLESGLYHFSVQDFALCKLRDGAETLAQIKRGRPDLEFVKTTPALLLVSTIFCRSTWRFTQRGYRHAVAEAGQLIQNLATAGAGIGLQTLIRLTANAQSMRDLIGLGADALFGDAEAVQGLVIWADPATHPLAVPRGRTPKMPPIPRTNLAQAVAPCDAVVSIHQDCVAPGVAIREVRPPLTELSPLPEKFPSADFPAASDSEPSEEGQPLDKLLLAGAPPVQFGRAAFPRNRLLNLARCAFRWGASYPLFPDGPYAALVRPLWIINQISGMDCGAWYYDPIKDTWRTLRAGEFRDEAQNLMLADPLFANAAAVCFLISHLHRLINEGGPDLYRLAHLEAGAAAHRLHLAAYSLDLACQSRSAFRDDDIRLFFGLHKTGWQPLYAAAVGIPA